MEEDSDCASCHLVLCLEIESLLFGFAQHYTDYAQMSLTKVRRCFISFCSPLLIGFVAVQVVSSGKTVC